MCIFLSMPLKLIVRCLAAIVLPLQQRVTSLEREIMRMIDGFGSRRIFLTSVAAPPWSPGTTCLSVLLLWPEGSEWETVAMSMLPTVSMVNLSYESRLSSLFGV